MSFLNITHTSALTYQDNIGLEFTFTPTINVSISGDLSIDELVPGGYSDSNIVNVNVATNNTSGYYLSATVGDDTNNPSTELRHSSYDSSSINNPIFTSLNTNDSYSSFSDSNIAYNTWGYSYSLDGTNWSNYSGLPLYNNAGTKLKENYNPTSDDIQFKIAAKAGDTQVSGAYSNTINFIATAHPTPLSLEQSYAYYGKQKVMVGGNSYYTMQDMGAAVCQSADVTSTLQVVDIRDNSIYSIGLLKDGNCWLLDNLRLDLAAASLDSLQGNTNASDSTLNYLKNGGGVIPYATAPVVDANVADFTVYNKPYINTAYKDTEVVGYGAFTIDSKLKVGVYYNYCAATAGSYCYYSSSTGNAVEDICSSGWHMPSSGNNGEYTMLRNAYNITRVADDMASLQYNLSTPLSGLIRTDGGDSSILVGQNEYGRFWSSTISDRVTHMLFLNVTSTSIIANADNSRQNGLSVRCVANQE